MSQEPLQLLMRGLRRLNDGGGLSDAQLLERFVAQRDEAAFELLVWRHGPTVLGVLGRLLRNERDIEDAFQATFLVLVRKAAAVAKRAAIGSWLYKVAYRIALDARRSLGAHARCDTLAIDPSAPPAPDETAWRELRPILDEAVMALPEKYRAAFVLCCIEGKTNEEASRQLGCAKGTIASRLARARARLQQRLARRGIGLAAGALACALAERALATVPVHLAQHVLLIARGSVLVSARVAALAEGVLHVMLLTKIKFASAAVLAVGLVAGAAGVVGPMMLAQDTPPARAQKTGEKKAPADPAVQGRAAPAPAADAGEAARIRALRQSQNNLKAIGIALHNHHDAYKHFPSPAIYDQNGKPLLSWRVALLPFIDGGAALYNRFKLDEPWDSAHNLRLAAEMPAVYASVLPTKQKNVTYYQAFVGAGALFEPRKNSTFVDVLDGTTNTLAVVEAAEPVIWTKPEDLPFVPDQALPKLGGQFPGYFNALCADGSIQLLGVDGDAEMLRRVIQRDDGQPVDFEKLRHSGNVRGPLDTTVLRLENQSLEDRLRLAKEEIVELRRRIETLRAAAVKELAHPDPKAAELLGANARLRAALDDELTILGALRAEAARLEAMAKKAD
jgi:RNA polymerase sigma factor (sigma-70 family)